MTATIVTCRGCKRQIEDDVASCPSCGKALSESGKMRKAGAAGRGATPAPGARAAADRAKAAAATPAAEPAPSARRMVSDSEISAQGARWANLWLGLGLSAHVLAFAWAAFAPPMADATVPPRPPKVANRPLSDDDATAVRARLRSNDPDRRARAEARLRDAGAAVDFDHQMNPRPSYAIDSAELLDAWVEVRGNQLVGSVRAFFGGGLFGVAPVKPAPGEPPVGAWLRLVVRGGSLATPVELTMPAGPGEARHDLLAIASGLEPGRYDVDVVLSARWLASSGELKSLETVATTLSVEPIPAGSRPPS